MAAYLATAAAQAPVPIYDREGHRIAEAFESSERLTAEVEAEPITWLERRLVVLAKLNERGRGKRRAQDRAAFEARVQAILKQHQVEGLLRVECQEQIDTRTVRAYGDRPMRIQWQHRFEVSFERDEAALAEHRARLAWRAYITNHDGLTLPRPCAPTGANTSSSAALAA